MFNRNKIDINKINEKYGTLIEDLDFMMTFGASDRLLPYSKQDIENALLVQAIYHKSKNEQYKLNVITMCYMYLSLFLPCDRYNIIKIVYQPNGLEKLLKESKEVKDRFMAIQEEISADMLKRTEKLIELTSLFEPGATNLEEARKKSLENFREKLYR